MKSITLISSLFLVLVPILFAAPATTPPKAFGPVPTDRQMRWHELELYAFVHFTVDIEWKDGKVVAANLHNLQGSPCSVKIKGTTKSIRSAKGETTKLL